MKRRQKPSVSFLQEFNCLIAEKFKMKQFQNVQSKFMSEDGMSRRPQTAQTRPRTALTQATQGKTKNVPKKKPVETAEDDQVPLDHDEEENIAYYNQENEDVSNAPIEKHKDFGKVPAQ